MKVYLVGGAVRDRLLGYPSTERDWVVVGATPQDMLDLNYQQVGRDFPVFLHPETREEYALARTERKQGAGYYGFVCNFQPNITLEEDLSRRDLTINAIAMDDTGRIIDPYQGQEDIKNKILRHVSPAFIEDPVRVLRVARFAARYYHLGFRLANETRVLMYSMVRRGELSHLVAERVWQEWYRSLQEKNPEIFILTLRSCGALRVVLPEIDALFGAPNTRIYHPEVDSGIHTLMALAESVKLSDDPLVRFGALVHDLGKACTPMQIWPSQREHELLGLPIIESLCMRMRTPVMYRKFALIVSRFHLDVHRLYEMRASTIVRLLEKSDAFRRPELFEKLLLVCESDARGRPISINYTQTQDWRNILQECAKIDTHFLRSQGLLGEEISGEQIKERLHQQRVACVEQILGKIDET